MKLQTVVEYNKETVLHFNLRHHSNISYERLIDGKVIRVIVVVWTLL